MHDDAPVVDHVPLGQATQDASPPPTPLLLENLPAGQLAQAAPSDVPPVVEPTFPLGQDTQLVCPAED